MVLDLAILTAIAAVMLLPGIDGPVTPGSAEADLLERTVRMLQSGDWTSVSLHGAGGAAGTGSPALLHWLQGLIALASGQGADAAAWILRLPSIAGGIATVLFTYAVARTLGGGRGALVSGLLVASTVALSLSARAATADTLVAAVVVAAIWPLASLWSEDEPRRRFGRNLVFWLAIALGMLLRAPLIMMIAASALAVLVGTDVINGARTSRGAQLGPARLRALEPAKGLILVLLVVGPFLALAAVLAYEAPARLIVSAASFRNGFPLPFGSHAIMAVATFWPLFAFLPLVLARAVGRGAAEAVTGATPTLVAWVAPAWLVLEVLPQKSAADVLPLLPAIAIFAGLAVGSGPLPVARWSVRSGFLLIAAGTVLLAFGLNAAFVVVNERADATGLLVGLLAIAGGLSASRLLRRGRARLGIAATVMTAILLSVLAFAVLPESRRSLVPVPLDEGARPGLTPEASGTNEAVPPGVGEPAPGQAPAELRPEPPPPARTEGFF